MRKKKIVTRRFVTQHIISVDDLKKEDFSGTIMTLKQNAGAKNIVLSDSEIAEKISITTVTYNEYLANNEIVPDEIFDKLRGAYPDFLIGRIHRIVTTTSHPAPSIEDDFEDM